MTSDVGVPKVSTSGSMFPSSLPAVTASGAAIPPQGRSLAQRVAAVPGLTRSELRDANQVALEGTLLGMLAAVKNRPAVELQVGELHENGSLRISSLVAVWMIGRVSEAYGRRKMIKLANVTDLDALRSLGGLAGLLGKVINAEKEGTLV